MQSPEEDVGEVSDEDQVIQTRFDRGNSKRSPLCKELSDLVYLQRIRCYDFAQILKNRKYYCMLFIAIVARRRIISFSLYTEINLFRSADIHFEGK